MDEETPTLRLLRPQDMALERLLRNYVIPVMFRMNLGKAREEIKNGEWSRDAINRVSTEYQRYIDLLEHLSNSPEGLQLIITDSQAFDVVANWTPEKYALTSFSIMMAHYMSHGNLQVLYDGVKAVDTLKPGDNILISEGCNHDRKCNDIGTVQLPKILEKKIGGKLNFDFAFGRTFPEDLSKFKLIVHCGACMIDRQKYERKLIKAKEAKIPFTNYGFLLSYAQNEDVLKRVIKPFAN
jgi:hypothetical protein